jgi:FkbM family methyltransferase
MCRLVPPRLYPLFERIFETLARSRVLVALALAVRQATTELIAHRITVGGLDHERNGEAWFMRQMATDCRTFVDVGANVGAWTRLMLTAAPQAAGVLFEPSNDALSRLRAGFGDDDRVRIVAAAVSDAPGTLTFYEEREAGETSSLLAGHSQSTALARTVEVVTLDQELSRLEIDHVDLLKIDAEGFDLNVLRGARDSLAAGRIEALQFEYNAPWALAGATLAAASALLRDCGFELFALREGQLRTVDPARIGELFAYANYAGLGPRTRARLAGFIRGDALD